MHEMAQIFSQELCRPNRRKLFNVQLFRSYWCHVWAILGPYLSYFINIFACRCLKWLKFSLKCITCQIEQYFRVRLFGAYWSHLGHIRALFWLFLQFIYFGCPKWLKFLWKSHAYQLENTLNVDSLGTFYGHISSLFWLCLHYLCFLMHDMSLIVTEKSCMPKR